MEGKTSGEKEIFLPLQKGGKDEYQCNEPRRNNRMKREVR